MSTTTTSLADSAASTSTPVSTRSGVAPRTIAVKSARELSPLPPITCARNISRIACRADSGASTPMRGTTLSASTCGVGPSASATAPCASTSPATTTGPGQRREDGGVPDESLGVAAVRATHQQQHVGTGLAQQPRPSPRRARRTAPRPPCRRWRAPPGDRPRPSPAPRCRRRRCAGHRRPTSRRAPRPRAAAATSRVSDARHASTPSSTSVSSVVRWLAVASSSPASSTSAALVNVEPTSTQTTADDGDTAQPACVTM